MFAISMKKSSPLATVAFLLGIVQTSVASPGFVSPPRQGAPSYKRPWIGEACKQEFLSLCTKLPNDSRRDAIVECLRQHAENLSPSCREAIYDSKALPESPQAPSPIGGRSFGRRHAQPPPDVE